MKIFFLQKKMMRFIYSLILFCFLILPCFAIQSNHGMDGYVQGKIDATKNARLHSNMGNIYFDEKKYISALKEYEIAYNIAPNTQASGAYLNNIAKCYLALGNFRLAKNAIEGAIKKDCINMEYYQTLVDCYIKLGIAESELKKHIADNKNPYNRIVVGLIYLYTERKFQARATFDDFVVKYPDMIITDDVRSILRQM